MSTEHDVLELLRDSAERSFADLATKQTVDAAEAGRWPQALWTAIEELGFVRAALPEAQGGSGLPLADALVLARVAARHALPLPLGESLVAGWLLAQAGHEVPAGPLSFAAVDRNEPIRLEQADGGWRLDGRVRGVPWGQAARRIVLVLQPARASALVASLDPAALGDSVTFRTRANLAGEPRSTVEFRGTPVAGALLRPLPQLAAFDPAAEAPLLLGALLRAQQLAGALQATRELAVRYASERIAFGKPLNKLPAVQQNLAVLAGQAAAAAVAADMGLDALQAALAGESAPAELTLSVAMAKARAGEAAGIAAQLAHQVHGAIGFTYEHRLHHFTRRLWSWRDEFGNEASWSTRAGARLVALGPDALWDGVTRAACL